MGYDRNKIYKQALADAEEHELLFIEDVVSYLPCNKDTFYRFFPTGSDEYDEIKEVLDRNKTNKKVSMRKKWFESDNATLQVALMKIIATNEEAHRLNGTKQENKITGNININPKEWIE